MSLATAVADWVPPVVEVTEEITPGPAIALAGLLDIEPPLVELPLGWHWVYFLDRPAQRELGPDGCPRGGPFMPPVPSRHRMFAGGRLTGWRPLRVGETVTRRSELTGLAVKNGRQGELLFVTTRHTFVAGDAVLIEEERDIVYRGATSTRPPAPRSSVALANPAPWAMRIATDEALLFRFSALTYNAHRIHYDRGYTTGVERYPDLVVQGPLLALLCLELPRRNGCRVWTFSARARSPVYVDQPFDVLGSPHGRIQVVTSPGAVVMSATFATAPREATPCTDPRRGR